MKATRRYERKLAAVQPPATQYVEREGTSIAYQVVGDGDIDLLLAPGFISHLDLAWTDPGLSKLLSRLASFARLILYDKPGTGLSDPVQHLPTLEERGADIEAVLDAAGSERAVLFGISEGGPASVVLAATRPERVASLVLYGTFAAVVPAAPEAYPPELVERWRSMMDGEITDFLEHWGDGARLARVFAPSIGELQQRFWGTFARAAASPRMAQALIRTLLGRRARRARIAPGADARASRRGRPRGAGRGGRTARAGNPGRAFRQCACLESGAVRFDAACGSVDHSRSALRR